MAFGLCFHNEKKNQMQKAQTRIICYDFLKEK